MKKKSRSPELLLTPLPASARMGLKMALNRDEKQERWLLVIDQAPLLYEALDACQKACAQIERLRSELNFHETRDVPAYERWYNATFGRYLTEIRELKIAIGDRERQLSSAKKKHWARFFGSANPTHFESTHGYADPHSEWAERAEWEGFHEEDLESRASRDEEEGEYGPEHEEFRFQEDEGGAYDDEQGYYYSEDDDSRRRFEDLFVKGSAWRSRGFHRRARSEEEFSRERPGSRASSSQNGAGPEGATQDIDEPSREQNSFLGRIKERYRILVRKLHPDINTELTAEAKSLWIQVQAAYQQRNLEQLDVLLALSDAFVGKLSESTGLHQLRRSKHEIERLIAPLRKKLDEARQNRAWKFSETPDRAPLQRVVEKEFQRERMFLRSKLSQLEAQLQRFSRMPTAHSPESRADL